MANNEIPKNQRDGTIMNLKSALEQAEKGDLQACIVIGIDKSGDVMSATSACSFQIPVLLGGMDILKMKLCSMMLDISGTANILEAIFSGDDDNTSGGSIN